MCVKQQPDNNIQIGAQTPKQVPKQKAELHQVKERRQKRVKTQLKLQPQIFKRPINFSMSVLSRGSRGNRDGS